MLQLEEAPGIIKLIIVQKYIINLELNHIQRIFVKST